MTNNLKKKFVSMQIKMAHDCVNNKDGDYKSRPPVSSDGPPMGRVRRRELSKRALRLFLNRLRLRRVASADISPPDPCYKVVYLGNVLTGWAKGESCVEKPLSTLWRNYVQSPRADVRMTVSVASCGGGLRATTRDHGLTEYWAHRISFCAAPSTFPRLFCWVYRHEGRRLRHELRCHAVLCSSASVARRLAVQLRGSVAQALAEFKRDKIARQNARLSLANACYENPSMPRRKILLTSGVHGYKPPLERSKSAPKLTMIEENIEEEEIFEQSKTRPSLAKVPPHLRHLRHIGTTSLLLDKKYADLLSRLPPLCPIKAKPTHETIIETHEENEDSNKSQENCKSFSKRNFSMRKCKSRTSNRYLKSIPVNNTFEIDNEELESIQLELRDIDAQSKDLIEELLAESIRNNDLCKINDDGELQAWLDSDDGSLSSGCDSASTTNSETDQGVQSQSSEDSGGEMSLTSEIFELLEQRAKEESEAQQTDFKVGGCVLSNVRNLERVAVRSFTNYLNENDEVSLIPVGEISNDFSSLRIFKKKAVKNIIKENVLEDGDTSDVEDDECNSSCSDESGYEELVENTTQPDKVEVVA